MSFEEALFEFRNKLTKEYGVDDGLVKIALSPELFDRVFYELAQKAVKPFYSSIMATGEIKFMGIQLVARRRDDF